jgi:hypothetical protein
MALLGFKEEFVALVEAGVKRQTIRARRAYPIKRGDPLTLAAGVRTKRYRRLYPEGQQDIRCTDTIPVAMIRANGAYKWFIEADGVNMANPRLQDLARRDGFADVWDMSKWFDKHHLARKGNDMFEGDAIRW